MKTIYERTDVAFTQALRCLEYRLPEASKLKRKSFLTALGLRYGMIGIAASHHLLLTADDEEEVELLGLIRTFPSMVDEHLWYMIAPRFNWNTPRSVGEEVSRCAAFCLGTYFPLYRRLVPLEHAMMYVAEAFEMEFQSNIYEGWIWFKRIHALSHFREVSEQSLNYALNFFERRQHDLEELPEIALIGE